MTSEFHDALYTFTDSYIYEVAVPLAHRSVTLLTTTSDKIEVWDGSSWVDALATKTRGRDKDFWVDTTNGVIYFVSYRPLYADRGVCVTYHYGEATVPRDIKKAAILLTAIDLVENDIYKSILPSGVSQDTFLAKTERWRQDLDRILAYRREVFHASL